MQELYKRVSEGGKIYRKKNLIKTNIYDRSQPKVIEIP